MKFTVPQAEDHEQAENVWTSVRAFLDTQGRPTADRRIARITFVHNGKPYDLSVGDIHPDLREPVLVILKGSGLNYICTPNRGVIRGEPYLVTEGAHLYDFDPD